ncbi:bifunctional phosphoribosyl-AMP cyclohydrolase/phosphoribosyl-ATP diphosphatase HisIE [Helicobacter sp.]|uniref:bifunctional phosphoribosyl-AMP cyclohydrolase/phosphoribosyl-ATP diphosphatase HisIE n=1 Tax=Helicobacter sp. TaxID=218 RepID=UPI0025B9269A|nr:bifunctional phosphoribosyl-AMP cyclohydrolase/phosphoribosyl-ATP diphosphatase HisIE [Helicobacter sp.]MCI5969493.1 bifunctional phosphoribosyl-AMP cyclohydrolase/phosphoribosyl-ATP diphosphatase HisIE [Helicobacter sp.]MDY2584186.1 bifunctional phosphoribosyl-AMP cyclohydrolase/phosphoribosyl-ATP diphosphatase HisIE [Helicobacter sp.]
MQAILEQILWEKCGGLIPAIAQDYQTQEVLMLGFMDKEALELSLKSGFVHYFSRSKGRIWKKGEQSGHTQKIHTIALDCDKDSILIGIEQIGVACHTGKKSCFFNTINIKEGKLDSNMESKRDMRAIYGAVDVLYHTLLERKCSDPKTSYTAKLYQKGENTIAKKIVEEASELGFAIKDGVREEIIYEAADLLYHSLVGLAYKDISPDLIKQEILRRFGLSGIDEKNAREE